MELWINTSTDLFWADGATVPGMRAIAKHLKNIESSGLWFEAANFSVNFRTENRIEVNISIRDQKPPQLICIKKLPKRASDKPLYMFYTLTSFARINNETGTGVYDIDLWSTYHGNINRAIYGMETVKVNSEVIGTNPDFYIHNVKNISSEKINDLVPNNFYNVLTLPGIADEQPSVPQIPANSLISRAALPRFDIPTIDSYRKDGIDSHLYVVMANPFYSTTAKPTTNIFINQKYWVITQTLPRLININNVNETNGDVSPSDIGQATLGDFDLNIDVINSIITQYSPNIISVFFGPDWTTLDMNGKTNKLMSNSAGNTVNLHLPIMLGRGYERKYYSVIGFGMDQLTEITFHQIQVKDKGLLKKIINGNYHMIGLDNWFQTFTFKSLMAGPEITGMFKLDPPSGDNLNGGVAFVKGLELNVPYAIDTYTDYLNRSRSQLDTQYKSIQMQANFSAFQSGMQNGRQLLSAAAVGILGNPFGALNMAGSALTSMVADSQRIQMTRKLSIMQMESKLADRKRSRQPTISLGSGVDSILLRQIINEPKERIPAIILVSQESQEGAKLREIIGWDSSPVSYGPQALSGAKYLPFKLNPVLAFEIRKADSGIYKIFSPQQVDDFLEMLDQGVIIQNAN